ncbi:MAG: YidC/Oxa1 family membrane protein insertase [Clostridia bacterium]|nr:YidC/Oxa1 family membrane protein insertase [Clostridia bacterium]
MTLSLLAVAEPSGMWANLINWVHSWVGGGYGWTILVLIILLKLVLSPLDYLIKHSSKKTALVQQKLAPQMAKLQKKYGDNRQMIQTQQQALYKREGYNVWGSCVVMLINLVLTMVIFFTLFSGLRSLSSYQAINQYDALHNTYRTSVETSYGSKEAYEEKAAFVVSTEEGKGYDNLSSEDKAKWDEAQAAAKAAVSAKWGDVADSWLWVKNVWVIDGHAAPLPAFKDMQSMANTSKNQEYIAYVNNIANNKVYLQEYNNIAGAVEAQTSSWNGYYLLAIISVLLSVASQVVNDMANKNKNKKSQAIVDQANPQGKSMWFMKLLIPVMMAIFVLTTNAAFGIYVVTNSIMSTLIGLLTNLIVNAVFKKKQEEVNEALAKEANRLERKFNKGAK